MLARSGVCRSKFLFCIRLRAKRKKILFEMRKSWRRVACKWTPWRDVELGRAGIVVLCRNNYYLAGPLGLVWFINFFFFFADSGEIRWILRFKLMHAAFQGCGKLRLPRGGDGFLLLDTYKCTVPTWIERFVVMMLSMWIRLALVVLVLVKGGTWMNIRVCVEWWSWCKTHDCHEDIALMLLFLRSPMIAVWFFLRILRLWIVAVSFLVKIDFASS